MTHMSRFAMLAAVALWLAPAAARAQDSRQLSEMSLEELMRIDVERVFGASQRTQPVTEAPSSVTIITADEIDRYGYRSLADILRAARGLYVSDDRNYSYVGVRGFARSGDYNTRVLLLVNGHRVNDNVYDQAGIGADLGIDPAMFERVEIIRGPASSLYGTSAFFAVVNVITRTGASMRGGSVTLEGGTLGTGRAGVAVGERLANGVDFALSGTYQRSHGVHRLYFPAFDTPDTNGGIAEDLDGERLEQMYSQVSFKDVTITGAYGRRRKDVPTASFDTVFNEHAARERTTDRRGMVDAQFEHSIGGTRLAGRASYDRYYYDGVYPLPVVSVGDPVLINYDAGLGARWGLDGRLTRELAGRQTMTAGVEFFDNIHQDQRNSYDATSPSAFSIERSSHQGAVYAQDEIRARRWLLFNVGLRYDTYGGRSRTTPRAAVIFTPSPNQSIKYLYGQAFRAPNVYELVYHSAGIENTALQPESIDTHEVVWERYIGEWLRTSASTYWFDAKHLITLREDPTTFDGLSFVNAGHARAKGLELEGEVRLKNGVQGVASYALQHATDQDTGAALTNSPRHMAKLRLSIPAGSKRSFASAALQYLSSRLTLGGNRLPSVALANVSLLERIRPSLEVVGTVDNLFDRAYADPASDEHLQDSIPQNGRTFRAAVRWTFLAR